MSRVQVQVTGPRRQGPEYGSNLTVTVKVTVLVLVIMMVLWNWPCIDVCSSDLGDEVLLVILTKTR